jgi:hypothetical protein
MSKGDNLFGVKRTYKGIEFRSGLECRFALILDKLNIIWEYEPKKFLLSNGIFYVPDFYLPELKTWIEVKGVIEEHNLAISRCFVKDNKTEMLLISENDNWFFSATDFIDGIGEDNEIYIGKCSNCKSFFFCGQCGLYHCRKCKMHEGDHDLLDFVKGISWMEENGLD